MVVVTARAGDQMDGCLVGFSVQCSMEPTRYLVCLSKANCTYRIALEASTLVVNVPHQSPRDFMLARQFGEQTGFSVDKFAECEWEEGPDGIPVLVGCDCSQARSSAEPTSATTSGSCSTSLPAKHTALLSDTSVFERYTISTPAIRLDPLSDVETNDDFARVCPYLHQVTELVRDPESSTANSVGRRARPIDEWIRRHAADAAYLAHDSVAVTPEPEVSTVGAVGDRVHGHFMCREHEVALRFPRHLRSPGELGHERPHAMKVGLPELEDACVIGRRRKWIIERGGEHVDSGILGTALRVIMLPDERVIPPGLIEDGSRKGFGVVRAQQPEVGILERHVQQCLVSFALGELGPGAFGPDGLANAADATPASRKLRYEALPRRDDARRIRTHQRHVRKLHAVVAPCKLGRQRPAQRRDLFGIQHDENGLVLRNRFANEPQRSGHELLAARVEQRLVPIPAMRRVDVRSAGHSLRLRRRYPNPPMKNPTSRTMRTIQRRVMHHFFPSTPGDKPR